MALIYMNGFEWGSTYENIYYQYGVDIVTGPSYGGDGKPYPRSGSRFAWLYSTDWLKIAFPAVNEFYVQIAMNISSFSYDFSDLEYVLINFRPTPASGTVIGSISYNPAYKRFSAWSGFKSTLLATSTILISIDQWYVYEYYWKFDTSSSGRFISRINGNMDMSYTGSTGTNSTCSSLDFVPRYDAYPWSDLAISVDDIVINDTTGIYNTAWPNGARVILLHPNGKGANSQWNKNPSNYIDNYECVDGWPSWDPSEYNYTDQNAMVDTFTFPNVPDESNTILAVRPDAWTQKNSGTTLQLELAVIPPSGSATFSSPQNLNISYNLQQNVWEYNPHTSSSWTPSEVNEIEAGYKSIV